MHIRRTGEERQTPGEKTAHKATDVSPIPSPWRKFSPFPVEDSGGAESPRTTNGPHAVYGPQRKPRGRARVVARPRMNTPPSNTRVEKKSASMSHLEIIELLQKCVLREPTK